MNLEELNKQYLDLKQDLSEARNDIENADKQSKAIDAEKKLKIGDKIILEGELEKAKRDKNDTLIKAKTDEIARIDEEIKKLDKKMKDMESKLKTYKENIKGFQKQINEKLEELEKNPEMKKHIEEVIAKRYSRKLKKEKEEKQSLIGKKEKIEKLQELVSKSSSVKNYLIGIINSTNEINKLREELTKIQNTDPTRAKTIKDTLIPKLEEKINKNKGLLMSIKGLDFTDEDIKELLDSGIIVSKDGKINLKSTLNNRKERLNIQVNRYTKTIESREKALEKFGVTEKTNNDSNNQEGPRKITRTGTSQEDIEPDEETEEKPKWYQFIKRFKNWNDKRKQKLLTDPKTDPKKNDAEKKEDFKESLKYDIVKALYEKTDKATLKEAAKEVAEEHSLETPISADQEERE